MAYIKLKDNKIEIISCTPKVAKKLGLIKEPENFKISEYGKLNADFYNKDYTLKTENELIEQDLIEDNRGIYYYTNTIQEIEINQLNVPLPENTTKLKPVYGFPKWENDKWIYDIKKIKDKLVGNIKLKANEIIISKYEYTKQLNILKRTAQLQDIVIFGGEFTESELAEYNELKTVGIWIDDIRNQSNEMENEVNKLDIENLKTYEIKYITELVDEVAEEI